MRINYEATDEIRNRIEHIGRTEDIKFSPDGKQFIIVEFLASKLHLFTCDIHQTDSSPSIHITGYSAITSPEIKLPHGVCYLDNHTIAVCNRIGGVSIFKIPGATDQADEYRLTPEKVINGQGLFTARVITPGSVHSHQISKDRYWILVCNNNRHAVTSHIVDLRDGVKITNEGIRIEHSLCFPDGVSISPDGKWIAISNHDFSQVSIFENTPGLNKKSPPATVFDGPVCPHGIRFSPDGKTLYVADAATKYLYIFESKDGNWGSAENSCRSVQVVDDQTFYYGKYGLREGGVKGIDIHPSNLLLAVSHRMEVLGFFDVSVLDMLHHKQDKEQIAEHAFLREATNKTPNENLLYKHWPQGIRLVHAVQNNQHLKPGYYKQQRNIRKTLKSLEQSNLNSGELLTDASGPVVSLTSHGERLQTVFYTIESVRRGSVKPSRIILWLDNEDKENVPETLLRLQKAGLEIYFSENIGPHKKYYPFIREQEEFEKPLVTADDDKIYARNWLENLLNAYNSDPSVIHCYGTRRIRLMNTRFIPQKEWNECGSHTPSHLNYIMGASGVIYPPKFLDFLKDAGDEFLSKCPTADDIWLTANALRAGFKISQVEKKPKMFMTIPGSQKQSLHTVNVVHGGNHHQLVNTFTDEDMQKLKTSLFEEKSPSRETITV